MLLLKKVFYLLMFLFIASILLMIFVNFIIKLKGYSKRILPRSYSRATISGRLWNYPYLWVIKYYEIGRVLYFPGWAEHGCMS